MLNGIPHQVVGVLPPDVAFPQGEPELFLPLVLQAPDRAAVARVAQLHRVRAIEAGRVALAQARSEMDRIGKDLEQQYPQLSRGHGAHVTSLPEEITGPVERTLVVLMAAVGFILLIACINVTNLLLAQGRGAPARNGRAIGHWRRARPVDSPGARRVRRHRPRRRRGRPRARGVVRARARRAIAGRGAARSNRGVQPAGDAVYLRGLRAQRPARRRAARVAHGARGSIGAAQGRRARRR